MDCEKVEEDPPILMKSQPHAHSHGIRSITFVLALSIHSVIEGLALGVQKEKSEVTALFFSLMVLKLMGDCLDLYSFCHDAAWSHNRHVCSTSPN